MIFNLTMAQQMQCKGAPNQKNKCPRGGEVHRTDRHIIITISIREGDHVEAKLHGWTKYYGGKVTSVNDDGTYDYV